MPVDAGAAGAAAALDACAELFGRVERTLFAQSTAQGVKPEKLKNAYLKRFGITARQFNAIRVGLDGKTDSVKERRTGLIDEAKTRLKKLGTAPKSETPEARATSLARPDNAVVSMVELERSASPAEISQIVGRLAEKLQAPQNRELRRALAVWIRRLVLRRFAPEGDVPELQHLPETHHMISERVDSWTQEWPRQGMQQGMQQGRQQGLREGQAIVLRGLLEQRFGVLPTEISRRIDQAGLDQLRDWFTRILTAESLGAVFAGQ